MIVRDARCPGPRSLPDRGFGASSAGTSSPEPSGAALLAEIQRCCKVHALAVSRFGRMLGDPAVVFRLQQGAAPRPATVERVRQLIAEIGG